MIEQEIFRHCRDKLKEVTESKKYTDFYASQIKIFKDAPGTGFYSRFGNLGLNVDINMGNKLTAIRIDPVIDPNPKTPQEDYSNMLFEVTAFKKTTSASFEYDKDNSLKVQVYRDDKRLTSSPNLVEQYKSLLKAFSTTVNVEFFKLSKKMKEEGVEPKVINCISDLIRIVTTGLISTSNDQIILGKAYNRRLINKFIKLI